MPMRFVTAALVLLCIVGGLGGCFGSGSAPQQPRSFAPDRPAPVLRPAPILRPAQSPGKLQPARPRTVMKPTAQPRPSQAVVDYLAFLKNAEGHRQMLLSDRGEIVRQNIEQEQTQEMLDAAEGGTGRPTLDPVRSWVQETDRQYSNWAALLRCLDSRECPAECAKLATAYRASVYLQTAYLWQIRMVIHKATGENVESLREAQSELTAMRNDSRTRQSLDAAERNAQAQLRALRARYDLRGTGVPDL